MQNTAFQNVFCKEVALFVLFIYFIIKLFKYSQFWPKFPTMQVFLKQGILMKLSRKVMQPRMFFLVSEIDTFLSNFPSFLF